MKNLLKHKLYRSKNGIRSEGTVTVIVTIVLLLGACVCAMADPVPGANVNVSNLGASQSEVGIAVDPTNPLNLIAVANDLGDLSKLATWWSSDGGTTWNASFLDETQDGFGANDSRFDPNVAFDSDGIAYVVYSINGAGINAVLVARSINGGITYTSVTTVTTDANNANNLHTAMVTTRSDGDATVADDVLVVWARPQGGGESIEAALSLDAGLTFPTQNNNINDALQRTFVPWASVDESGNFEVVWEVNQGNGVGVILHDTLNGTTLADGANNQVTTVQITDFAAATSSIPAQPDRGIFSVATVEVNRTSGRIYVTYTDRPSNQSNDTDIYSRFSDNNGANWSARLQINDDNTGTSQFMPRMAVDHTSGIIYAIWYDARNDVTNNQQVDIYVSQSCDNLATWTPNVQVTTARSDESTANPLRNGNNYLEYIGLTANAGVAHACWTDARAANFTNGTNEDTYTAVIGSGPVITCPGDVTLECDESTDPSNTGSATATSNCGTVVSLTFSDAVIITCGQAGTITRTWTATDSFGNSNSCVQTITVRDTTDPVLNPPADVTIECDESTDPSNTGSAAPVDNCDTDVTLSYSDAVAAGACPQEQTITRTWTATDDCGNSTSADQTIDVVDTTKPVISCNAPDNITPPDAPISFTATATDNCDPDPAVVIKGFDCFKLTKKLKKIDKKQSCEVQIDGNTITILDSGGVGDIITWTVEATDGCGNVEEVLCSVLVVNPAK